MIIIGAIIPSNIKVKYLPFIKSNFNKISQREIARRLNIGKTTVNRWAREIGLKFKKHTVNEKFFDEFNEYSTYLLGLIYADGNIAWDPKKGYYTLTITASAKDKEHLEKLRNLLSTTKPLLYSPKTNSYRLIINNKKICKRLMLLGVTPRKTLTIRFPEFIPYAYLNHFIRGIVDGDGSLKYIQRKRSPYFEIEISSGSKLFSEELVKTIRDNISVDTKIKKRGKNTYLMRYTCSRGKKLANFLYSNATLFLKRKYLKYKQCLEVKRK